MLILILFKIGITNFLSSIMLLLLSYCSVFKVQTWKFLPRRSRKWSFLCLLSCSQESKWWAWEDSNLRPHAYQACALTTWATSPFDFRRPVVVFRLPTPCGGDEEDRTPDPLLARQVLSQLSYTPIFQPFDWCRDLGICLSLFHVWRYTIFRLHPLN